MALYLSLRRQMWKLFSASWLLQISLELKENDGERHRSPSNDRGGRVNFCKPLTDDVCCFTHTIKPLSSIYLSYVCFFSTNRPYELLQSIFNYDIELMMKYPCMIRSLNEHYLCDNRWKYGFSPNVRIQKNRCKILLNYLWGDSQVLDGLNWSHDLLIQLTSNCFSNVFLN